MIVAFAGVEAASAGDPDAQENKTSPSAQTPEPSVEKKKSDLTEEGRKAAMAFVSENHAELARLLEQLEKSRPNEFARATKELSQQIQQLERIREKSPVRYEAQLESWKQDSQIRVLMARWSRSNDPELEKQIRGLLRKRQQVRVTQLQADKERLLEQQRKIDLQLEILGRPVDAQVDKEWDQLAKKTGSRKANNNPDDKSPEKHETGEKK